MIADTFAWLFHRKSLFNIECNVKFAMAWPNVEHSRASVFALILNLVDAVKVN